MAFTAAWVCHFPHFSFGHLLLVVCIVCFVSPCAPPRGAWRYGDLYVDTDWSRRPPPPLTLPVRLCSQPPTPASIAGLVSRNPCNRWYVNRRGSLSALCYRKHNTTPEIPQLRPDNGERGERNKGQGKRCLPALGPHVSVMYIISLTGSRYTWGLLFARMTHIYCQLVTSY